MDVVVLEKDLEIDFRARGVTIHPRTLEVFEMRGMADTFLNEGVRIPGASFGQLPTLISYHLLDTEYPFVLGQPQGRTTQLIEERARALGADLRRGAEVTGIDLGPDGGTLTVTDADAEYVVEADWVIGCDGVHSSVRAAAGIEFPGTEQSATIWVGDVLLNEPIAEPLIETWGLEGTILSIQLPGGVRRFIGLTPEDVTTEWPGDFTFEELQRKVTQVLGTDFGMHSPLWMSRTSNQSRLATTYRQGRVLLAGDAAHRHFPLGGMGMNTGIQDAHDLGWRLAGVINGWTDEATLDEYDRERRAVGEDLMEATQAQTAMTVAFTPDGVQLRNLVSKLLAESPDLVNGLAERYAGLRVAYPSFSDDAHPLEGRRVPNAFVGDGLRVHDLLHDGRFLLLVSSANVLKAATLQPPLPHLAVHTVVVEPGKSPLDGTGAVLVRPDGYVAWAGMEASVTLVDDTLAAVTRWAGLAVSA